MLFYRNSDNETGWFPQAVNPGDNPHRITSVKSVFLNATRFTFDLMDNDYKGVDCHLESELSSTDGIHYSGTQHNHYKKNKHEDKSVTLSRVDNPFYF